MLESWLMSRMRTENSLANDLTMPVMIMLTALLVLAGIYFRFKGLAVSALAIDEYYIVTSVNSILQHGLPQLHGGGYYNRGILVQYLATPLFMAGLSPEFAFRLITVLSNLAALPAVFLLARHLGGTMAGCVAVVLFSLSLWQVEFARFARMYSPFAALFVWQLYFLYRAIVLDDGRALKWMLGLSLTSVFVFAGAIFMVGLNLLPLLLRRARRPLLEYLLAPALLLFTLYYGTFNFRRFGVTDYLPADFVQDMANVSGLPVHLPAVLLSVMPDNLPWLWLFMLPLLLGLATASVWGYRAIRPGTEQPRIRLLMLLPVGLILLALGNLAALVIYLTLAAFLLSGLSLGEARGLLRRPLILATAASIVLATLYWFGYALFNDNWQPLLPQARGDSLRDAVFVLIGYPDVYWEVLVQWLSAMPVQTLLMGALLALALWSACRMPADEQTPADRGIRLLGTVLLGCGVMVAVMVMPYSSTRYSYFLYPLVLVLSAVGLVRLVELLLQQAWSRGAATLGLVAVFMVVSEDFEARHLQQIDSERVTYRVDFNAGRQDQYYIRWDYRAAANAVNAHWKPGDLVISSEYSVPYYLMHLDYIYMDQTNQRFTDISASGGTREIWEGERLLNTADALLGVINETGAIGDVWLIIRSDRHDYRMPGEIQVSSRFQANRVFRSVDGYLDVYRIPSAATAAEAEADDSSNTNSEFR